MFSQMSLRTLTAVLLCIFLFGSIDADGRSDDSYTSKDALEGETILLDCKFDPIYSNGSPDRYIYYWHRTNHRRTDPVAIGGSSLDADYKVDFDKMQGKFNLRIERAQYDRDNGQFECKIKESGSGVEIKSRTHVVTILIPPGPPVITPSNPIAKEGEPFKLVCSSEGGSPDPIIQWHQNGELLEGEIENGGNRNKPTTNTLTIKPTLDLNGANYKCSVWNRATHEDRKQESFVSLTVHYKPRIKVGPYNPLSVSNEGNAEMSCHVEANPPVRSVKWLKNGQIIANRYNHTIFRVKPEDSGFYDCVAENAIGVSKESLQLSVLHGPQITLDSFKEASADQTIEIECKVTSNPQPSKIVWTKENDSNFKQTGSILKFDRITAKDIGNYVCSATVTLKPSGAVAAVEKTSNQTVQLQIKHSPGHTMIYPANPVAVAGRPFTLSCGANPPGYPAPEYDWWKEGQEDQKLGKRANYTFVTMHVSQEGRYFCQPWNSAGKGSVASIYLTVHEPAQVSIPMKPQFIAKEGDTNFKLTCIGRGKPRPRVTWSHNGVEINPETGEYRIDNKEQNEDADVKTITTTLYFEAMARKGANSLSATDRGTYACQFHNDIPDAGKNSKSETVLRVEHTPVVQHTYNRVAFDVGETAVLQCKMSAFPAPKFEWFFNGKTLDSDAGDRYSTNAIELPDDIHLGNLSLQFVNEADYGSYTCRASNTAGDDDERTIIELVKKTAPETPGNLQALDVLSDSVSLKWTEGFNGGYINTEFVVNYNDGEKSRNESCRQTNPCKVTGLESRHEYQMSVFAVNPKGFSAFSLPLKVVTKVNLKDMPSAFDSSYDRERNMLSFRVDPNDVSLKLMAKIEIQSETSRQWSPLANVDVLSDLENVYLKATPEQITDIRVILCLNSNLSWCGYEHLVKMDSVYTRETKTNATDHLFGVIIVSSVCAFLCVVVVFCCCWKKKEKPEKKDFESDASNERPNKGLAPNYYTSHDNKGLMSDMDTANMNKLASGIYGSTMGPMNGHIPQNYYLTGDGNSDPSPNGSNETGQTEFWNSMKSNMMHDNINDSELNYNAGYNMMNNQLIDPNGYINSYSYYPTQGYQPLDEDNLSRKNNLNMSYYDEMNGNTYGGAMTIDMMNENQRTSQLASYNGDETDYPANRARVMSEIIV